MMFIPVFSTIYLALNYYVYSRIAGGLKLSSGASRILLPACLLAALSFIPAEILDRRYGAEWIGPVLYLSSVWLGVTAIAFSVLVIFDIAGIIIRIKKFRYYATIGALILIGLASGYSVYNQAGSPAVKEIKIPWRNCPRTRRFYGSSVFGSSYRPFEIGALA